MWHSCTPHRRVRNNLRNQLWSGRATPTVSVPSFPFSLLPLNLLYPIPLPTNSALCHPPLSLNLLPSAPTPFYLFSSLPKFIHVKMAAEGMLYRSHLKKHRADAKSSSYTTFCAFFTFTVSSFNLNRTRLSQDHPGCAPRSSSHHQQQRGTSPHPPSSSLHQGSRYHHR
jgi:hypothetical protein